VRIYAFKANSPDVTRRILEEYKASKYVADVIDLSIGGLGAMRRARILQPYWSPELANVQKEAIEPHNLWTVTYQSFISLGFNTKEVPEAEAPKTLDDLLDPKWKGKMALPNGATVVEWVGALLREKNEDYIRKLGQQNLRVYAVTARAVANLVVSGEVALSPAMYSSHFANSRRQGASVAWRALGGVESFVGAEALAIKAPHPHAAMLFLDFSMSPEGQKIYQTLGYATTRTDLSEADKPAKIYYLTAEPTYTRDYEKWSALAKRVFNAQ
jgi:iron(III) transport system substrate-binding protein